MSNLSDLYTALKTRLATVLPSHTWLSDAVVISDNNEQFLRQGYALQIGAGENANLEVCPTVSIRREIIVTLTREHFALELNRDAKYTVEQALLDDQLLVMKEFERDPTAAYGLGGNIANFRFVSDSGIERVFEDKKNFYMLRSRFDLIYYESN